MRSIAVCGAKLQGSSFCDPPSAVSIDGVPVNVTRVASIAPDFDGALPEYRGKVLLEVKSFSCNYRDKALLVYLGQTCPPRSYCFIGSDFLGEILAVGRDVAGFASGDRVLGNCQYPDSGVEGVYGGIPTQHASARYHIFDPSKLMRVPENMSDVVAGGFAVGAQTTYSILRRLAVQPGQNVLVTGASSNTALFAVNALRRHNVNVYAASTSARFRSRLEGLGVEGLIVMDPDSVSLLDDSYVHALMSKTGGFDCVIDPFCDIYLSRVMPLMRYGGKYATCGFTVRLGDSAQNHESVNQRGLLGVEDYSRLILGNIEIVGNCLGETCDLRQALDDFRTGLFDVVIDSVFTGVNVGGFFDRTYNSLDRFGKVIYCY